MLATVELHTGRWCLVITGWVIAMETDPCREWHLDGNAWTKETLDKAAARINTVCLSEPNAGRSAAP